MDGKVATPAAEHMFKVNKDAEKLGTDDKDIYHSTTTKLLFLCKRLCLDIQTPVAFLCTQVCEPDVDDMKKLKHMICYLWSTSKVTVVFDSGGREFADHHLQPTWT